PPFQEETNFLLSTNQGCESSWLSRIKATGGTTLIEYVIDSYGLGDTAEGLCSQVLALKIALDPAMCRLPAPKRIGCCQSLQPRCQIRGLAQCQLLLTLCAAHGSDNDQTRMNPDPHSKLHPLFLLQPLIQVSHGIEHT